MPIFGAALLSFCVLSGLVLGQLLGVVLGVDANVGGVGIAMLLLIAITGCLQSTGRMSPPTQQGVLFWSSLYIPIVVAMAASQNVRAALRSGPVALLAAAAVVTVCFALVPALSQRGQPSLGEPTPPMPREDAQ